MTSAVDGINGEFRAPADLLPRKGCSGRIGCRAAGGGGTPQSVWAQWSEEVKPWHAWWMLNKHWITLECVNARFICSEYMSGTPRPLISVAMRFAYEASQNCLQQQIIQHENGIQEGNVWQRSLCSQWNYEASCTWVFRWS